MIVEASAMVIGAVLLIVMMIAALAGYIDQPGYVFNIPDEMDGEFNENPRRRRHGRKGSKKIRKNPGRSRWMKLVKKHGVKGAKARYHKNAKRKGTTGRGKKYKRNAKHRPTLIRSKGGKWSRPKRSKLMKRSTMVNPKRRRKGYKSHRKVHRNPKPKKFKLFGKGAGGRGGIGFPKKGEFKSAPLQMVGGTVLGVVIPSLAGFGMNKLFEYVIAPRVAQQGTTTKKVLWFFEVPVSGTVYPAWYQPAKDIARIGTITGVGLGMAHFVGKKNARMGHAITLGTTIAVGLDLLGMLISFGMEKLSPFSGAVVMAGYKPGLSGAKGIAMNAFGLGRIGEAMQLGKVSRAAQSPQGIRVLVSPKTKKLGLYHPTYGMLMQGDTATVMGAYKSVMAGATFGRAAMGSLYNPGMQRMQGASGEKFGRGRLGDVMTVEAGTIGSHPWQGEADMYP